MKHARSRISVVRRLVLLCFAISAIGAHASPEAPLVDLLSIQVFERSVVSIDAGGTGPTEKLEVGEAVVSTATRGAIGIALTDRRLLAVSSSSASWQSTRMGPGEVGPSRSLLGDRVALALTSRRAIGFEGRTSNLVESRFSPREDAIGLAIGENVGVTVTDRRILCLSAWAGGFFEFPLRVRETVEQLDAAADFVIVRSDQRLITFNGRTGVFTEKRIGAGR